MYFTIILCVKLVGNKEESLFHCGMWDTLVDYTEGPRLVRLQLVRSPISYDFEWYKLVRIPRFSTISKSFKVSIGEIFKSGQKSCQTSFQRF